MISKATIDAIYEAVQLEEVIQDFVSLKKSGSNFKGLSPFVDEKTPSFMVSPSKQIWKDFSSGKGGGAVAFIMEHEHFTYPEALRYLAKKYNIEIEQTQQTDKEKELLNQKESLFLVSEFAGTYFKEQLLQTDLGKSIGLSYFRQRGFTDQTIEKFQLGYSPQVKDAFSKTALAKGYQSEFLEKTGLSISKDNQLFDRFRGRVMFPIHSLAGRVLGFGGRILTNDKKVAKYLNSPESDIYHKSKVLYGIYFAKQAISKQDMCYLVEGYTDVIQMHQAGIENVVSSSGTALTSDQIRLINRLTKNITVLYDGDAAGLRASLRGIDLILEAGMNVRVCTFPQGEDPDSFAKKTPVDQLQSYLESNAKDFISFKTDLLVLQTKNDPIKRSELIRDILQSISKIPDGIQREVYLQQCAKTLEISEDVLFNNLAQIRKKDLQNLIKNQDKELNKKLEIVKKSENSEKEKSKVNVIYLLERKIIEILLLYGNYEVTFEEHHYVPNEDLGILELCSEKITRKVFDYVYLNLQEDEIEFTNLLFKGIYSEMLGFFHSENHWNLETYLTRATQNFLPEISSIILEDEKERLHEWERQNIFVKSKEQSLVQYVSETILTLRWYLVDLMINKQKESLKDSAGIDNSSEILQEIMSYTKLTYNFSNLLGRVISRF